MMIKAYLFHIWCADEQKEHPPLPGAVVAFFVILAPDTKLSTYLFSGQSLVLTNCCYFNSSLMSWEEKTQTGRQAHRQFNETSQTPDWSWRTYSSKWWSVMAHGHAALCNDTCLGHRASIILYWITSHCNSQLCPPTATTSPYNTWCYIIRGTPSQLSAAQLIKYAVYTHKNLEARVRDNIVWNAVNISGPWKIFKQYSSSAPSLSFHFLFPSHPVHFTFFIVT